MLLVMKITRSQNKMKIKHLERLQIHNSRFIRNIEFFNKGLTIEEIEYLESLYCPPGKQFPQVLREFLFLAGKYCIYFCSGITSVPSWNGVESVIPPINSKQEYLRNYIKDINPSDSSLGTNMDFIIPRPCWFFNSHCVDVFNLIYLDVDVVDPEIQVLYTYDHVEDILYSTLDEALEDIIHDWGGITLKSFINGHIDHFLEYGKVYS